MNDFDRNNKRSGVYWLKESIKDLSVKVTIKPQTSVINLPKYEDFVNASKTNDLSIIETDKFDEHTFKWQEKVFSAWEIDYYNDINNCQNDNDLAKHDRLNSAECTPQKVFTYINEDFYLPLPTNTREATYDRCNFNLYSCLENLNLEERIGGKFGGTNSTRELFSSNDDILEKQKWEAMHVVFDDSLYTEDSQLIRKQEYLMLSMFYNTIDNCLIVTPDVNDLVFNPYDVAMENAAPAIQYGVQINFGEFEKDEELVELLNKLHKRWQKKHKQLVRFAQAPLGIKKHYLMFEIMSASGFDMDNIYIEYDIKVPENIRCENTLHGRTHVSKGRSVDGCQEWSYGHFIELELEVAEEIEPSPLQMYFETISTDWWGRHRTEGYYYLPMPLSPGNFTKHLSSSRPEERNKVEADSRRFFVGGCHLIRDLEVLSKPQLQNADFTYTATGSVRVRWSIVAHTNTPGFEPASTVPSGSSTALLLGAEAVLKQYSQARARLAAATKDLEGDED